MTLRYENYFYIFASKLYCSVSKVITMTFASLMQNYIESLLHQITIQKLTSLIFFIRVTFQLPYAPLWQSFLNTLDFPPKKFFFLLIHSVNPFIYFLTLSIHMQTWTKNNQMLSENIITFLFRFAFLIFVTENFSNL